MLVAFVASALMAAWDWGDESQFAMAIHFSWVF